MRNRIYLSLAQMGGREQDFIREAFDTNWVVPLGPNVDAFERELADFIGQDRHVVALSAGTAAIHLGLVQLGVGRDDEVICQSFTFSASANPIASIFAWTGGLKHRADLDNTPEVKHFAETLEKVIISTVEGGQMTKDLAMLIGPDEPWLDTDGFMNALDENLAKALAE